MSTRNHHFVLGACVQAVVGGVLVYAAVTKATQIPMFAYVIQQSVPFMGERSTPALFRFAQAVVLIEMLVGTSLIMHLYSRWVRAAAVALFIGFSGVLLVMLFKDKPLSCGCMGFSPDGLGSRAELLFGLVRNFFLIGMLLTISALAKRSVQQEYAHAKAGNNQSI